MICVTRLTLGRKGLRALKSCLTLYILTFQFPAYLQTGWRRSKSVAWGGRNTTNRPLCLPRLGLLKTLTALRRVEALALRIAGTAWRGDCFFIICYTSVTPGRKGLT